MRIDFQEEVLKYLLQSKEGKKYLPLLDKSLWDDPSYQIVYDLFDNYVQKYGGSPTKVTLMEYFDREVKKSKERITKEVYNAIEMSVHKLYEPFTEDAGLIRDSMVEFAQRKKTKLLFRENADKVATGDEEFFRKLHLDMSGIVRMSDVDNDREKNRGGFLLHDFNGTYIHVQEGTPTFLRDLNRMTSARGFHHPQLVLFMGAPKSFKTGVVMNIVRDLVRDGQKVYWADTENGKDEIRNRFYQSMLECERHEINNYKKELAGIVKGFKAMGGDLNIGFFPAGQHTLDDVDVELQYYKDEFDWEPNVIVYDYLALFKGMDSRKEKRVQLQENYHKAIALNAKWGTWAINIATVNRNAVNKAVIDMTSFGEDFQQAYNCHAAFAICRTPEEMEFGTARIIPVVQRQGVPYAGTNTCTIQVEAALQNIYEVRMGDLVNKMKNSKKLKDE